MWLGSLSAASLGKTQNLIWLLTEEDSTPPQQHRVHFYQLHQLHQTFDLAVSIHRCAYTITHSSHISRYISLTFSAQPVAAGDSELQDHSSLERAHTVQRLLRAFQALRFAASFPPCRRLPTVFSTSQRWSSSPSSTPAS